MGTASIHIDRVSLAWRGLRNKLASRRASSRDCVHLHRFWRRIHANSPGILLEGARYCADECLEPVLFDVFERVRSAPNFGAVPHRIPLGLLLVSRRQLSTEQLRIALAAQRAAGEGRLGEWLLSLGFITEEKLVAALARQWSCPVLRLSSFPRRVARSPQIPWTLLEGFAMIPVDYVEATSTLHLAFGDRLDHSLLYAIETMTGSHTESCMAAPSFVRTTLGELFPRRSEHEVAFERPAETAECCRTIRSYCLRLCPSELRFAGCGPYVWVRLFHDSRPLIDLLFRTAAALSPSTTIMARTSA